MQERLDQGAWPAVPGLQPCLEREVAAPDVFFAARQGGSWRGGGVSGSTSPILVTMI